MSRGAPLLPELSANRMRWRLVILSALGIISAGIVAYHNSFSGVFLFDDQPAILRNPHIHRLWPLLKGPDQASSYGGIAGRPTLLLTLALNYAWGEFQERGYHAVNLLIHLLAALTLFGLLRQTLLGPRVRARVGEAATGLAFTTALLWVVHPLQTESVTYIIQRSEALMGLCYLFTLYCVVRGATSARPGGWYAAAVAACALGMGSKPVMGTAPFMVYLYDGIFLSPSFIAALRKRWPLYVGLAMTWLFLAVCIACHGGDRAAGFSSQNLSPLSHLFNQSQVLLLYLKLSVWPHPLVLDYAWLPIQPLKMLIMPTFVVGACFGATVWALTRRLPIGFLGAWFFLLLAPTSSIIPSQDLAVEHRMYLPVAAVLTLGVLGGWTLLRQLPLRNALRRFLAAAIVAELMLLLTAMTVRRNNDYASELTMLMDVVTKRPNNRRAQSYLGALLSDPAKRKQAIAQYVKAAQPSSSHAYVLNGLGREFERAGQLEDAISQYREALRLHPAYFEAQSNLERVLAQRGERTRE